MPAPLAAVEQDLEVCDEYFRHGPAGEVVAAVFASDSNMELIWAMEGCRHILVDLLKEVMERNKIRFLAMIDQSVAVFPNLHFLTNSHLQLCLNCDYV